jgi:uncharacterized membrane-anchored protein YhcB (DUF1043 family)
MAVTDKEFYISYIIGIILGIFIMTIVNTYFSYQTNQKIDAIYTILDPDRVNLELNVIK